MSYTYGFGELILDYFRWHYGRGVGELMGIVENFLRFVLHLFSIKLLLSTLFHPWRRMAESYGKGRLYITAQVVGEIVRITFDDDGPGIKPRDMMKIFEPFFSTKKSGLGLGLSISSAIVECHGGCIYAENRSEKGATFVVELPIVA